MSSQFGTLFRISTFGESHGVGVGVIIDGCPAQLNLCEEDIQAELDRRRPGQSDIVTPRKEADTVEILSGTSQGKTLGTSIAMLVKNKDQRPGSYDTMESVYRPSHADYTYDAKFGFRAISGGGRASARETIARVAAGAVAMKVLKQLCPDLEILAWVDSIQHLQSSIDNLDAVTKELIESTPVRAADAQIAPKMIEHIKKIRSQGDSVGGIVRAYVKGVPAGLGEPVFDKLEADLAKAMLSLPATKGFEIGSGFAGTQLTGSQHNDAFYTQEGTIRTKTNRSGGIQGGISNGEAIDFKVAFKPTATIMISQDTVNACGDETTLKGKGRHDACVLPRAVPIVESMIALVLCDHALRQRAQNSALTPESLVPQSPEC